MLSGTRANIAVKVFGDDLGSCGASARRCASRRQVRGAVDISLEQQMDVPVVRFVLNRTAIARYGLHPATSARRSKTSFAGAAVGRVFQSGTSFDLVVKFRSVARRRFRTHRRPAGRYAVCRSGAAAPACRRPP